MSTDIWQQIAAPLDPNEISWRIDSKPKERDGRWYARFVCYVEAGTVRERLDTVVPGEWNLTLTHLPECADGDGVPQQAFQARLGVLGVIREDVGIGPDYKQAATDAFKRVAVRFGIAHELYAMEQNWVEVDGDAKYAKPIEDPQVAYDRRYGSGEQRSRPTQESTRSSNTSSQPSSQTSERGKPATTTQTTDEPSCPKCGGRMWDNRATKRNKKAPDYKCRNRNCDGVIWPPKLNEVMDEQDYAPEPEYDAQGEELPF